jgi:aspartyl-tRNA synthetase
MSSSFVENSVFKLFNGFNFGRLSVYVNLRKASNRRFKKVLKFFLLRNIFSPILYVRNNRESRDSILPSRVLRGQQHALMKSRQNN